MIKSNQGFERRFILIVCFVTDNLVKTVNCEYFLYNS